MGNSKSVLEEEGIERHAKMISDQLYDQRNCCFIQIGDLIIYSTLLSITLYRYNDILQGTTRRLLIIFEVLMVLKIINDFIMIYVVK